MANCGEIKETVYEQADVGMWLQKIWNGIELDLKDVANKLT